MGGEFGKLALVATAAKVNGSENGTGRMRVDSLAMNGRNRQHSGNITNGSCVVGRQDDPQGQVLISDSDEGKIVDVVYWYFLVNCTLFALHR